MYPSLRVIEEVSISLAHLEVAAVSIDDYKSWFVNEGCDEQQFATAMLQDLATRTAVVNTSNVEEACAWTVQLMYDVGRDYGRDKVTFDSYDELRDELQSLIGSAIENL